MTQVTPSKIALLDDSVEGILSGGQKHRLLLLHGNSSCKEVFLPLMNFLSEFGIATLAIDLPGHGQSADAADPERSYSFPGYADVVFAVLEEMGWKEAGLFGWSLGGHIALECLARESAPVSITSAFIVGSPPGKPSRTAFEAAFVTNETTLLAGKQEFSAGDPERYTAAMLDGADRVTPDMLKAAKRTDGRARQCMLNNALLGVGADQAKVLEASNARIALVIGEADPFVRLDYLDKLPTERLWERKVHTNPRWGHAPHWQMDDTFKELLPRFYGIA